jgi:lipoate-protein ligase B
MEIMVFSCDFPWFSNKNTVIGDVTHFARGQQVVFPILQVAKAS